MSEGSDTNSKSRHQFKTGVFDIDYQMRPSMSDERKLTAQEWEHKLREEDRAKRGDRRRSNKHEEEITEADLKRVPTKYGALSGGNVVHEDLKSVGGIQREANNAAEVEITEDKINQMKNAGADVSALKVGKKVQLNPGWSRDSIKENDE